MKKLAFLSVLTFFVVCCSDSKDEEYKRVSYVNQCEYPSSIQRFWRKFKQAIYSKDKKLAITLTRFPLQMVGKSYTAKQFAENFDRIFDEDVLAEIQPLNYMYLECIGIQEFKQETHNTIPVDNYSNLYRFTIVYNLNRLKITPKWKAYQTFYFKEVAGAYKFCYYKTSINSQF
jgi:hypothetical protein